MTKAVNKSDIPIQRFFRRRPGVYSYLLNTDHRLVHGHRPVVEGGCLKIWQLCAYHPEGVCCGYDLEPLGGHHICDDNYFGSWINEFNAVKENRLTIPFEPAQKLQGLLVFDHPFGCTMVVASNLEPQLLDLLNQS